MTLYDEAIRQLLALLPGEPDRRAVYDPALCAPEGDKNAILFRGDTAYELGGGGKSAVCGVLFGDLPGDGDETLLYGSDLCGLDRDTPYAHFTVVSLKNGDEDALRAERLKEIAFRVFRLYPAGFHIRISPSAGREQVRVAREALGRTPPLSFLHVGSSLIRLFREDPDVARVRTVFVTRPDADYAALAAVARRAKQITDAVESALGANELDCASCKMKPVCDEVDGLRELHFKNQRERIR